MKRNYWCGQSKFWSEPELLSSYNRHAFHPQVVIGNESNPVVWAQEPVFPRYGGRVSDYAMHLEIAEWKYDVPEFYNVINLCQLRLIIECRLMLIGIRQAIKNTEVNLMRRNI